MDGRMRMVTKNICLIGVGFSLAMSAAVQASQEGPMEESPVLLCDLNEDGHCDSLDVEALQNALGKCQDEYRTVADMRADVDGDGCVTATDQQMLEEWRKRAVAHQEAMTVDVFVPCDLDRDEDCDEGDALIFSKSLGQCEEGDHYNELADVDHDGCVTDADQRIFNREMAARTRRGSETTP